MLDARTPYATPGFARYRLPGRGSWSGVVSDGLEGFARSFLLAACRIAGTGGAVDLSLTAPYSRSDIEGGLDRIEDWYVGDGWYTDGDGRNFDYYVGWAMHLYPLLWARIAGPDGDGGGRAAVYREQLSRFLEDDQHSSGRTAPRSTKAVPSPTVSPRSPRCGWARSPTAHRWRPD